MTRQRPLDRTAACATTAAVILLTSPSWALAVLDRKEARTYRGKCSW